MTVNLQIYIASDLDGALVSHQTSFTLAYRRTIPKAAITIGHSPTIRCLHGYIAINSYICTVAIIITFCGNAPNANTASGFCLCIHTNVTSNIGSCIFSIDASSSAIAINSYIHITFNIQGTTGVINASVSSSVQSQGLAVCIDIYILVSSNSYGISCNATILLEYVLSYAFHIFLGNTAVNIGTLSVASNSFSKFSFGLEIRNEGFMTKGTLTISRIENNILNS